MLHESHGASVGLQFLVCCQQHETLRLRLSDEHAVERVPVKVWKAIDRDGMGSNERQFRISVLEQPSPELAGIDLEIPAAKRSLDGDFPEADNAEMNCVASIREHACGCCRQPIGLPSRPQQEVRVEQEIHEW